MKLALRALILSMLLLLAASGTFDRRSSPSAYAAGAGTPGGEFFTMDPLRILDTRSGLGAPAAAVRAGQPLRVRVTGHGSVPASGVMAVVLNVTVDAPSAPAFLTVYPSGAARPNASNLNFVAGQTVANLAVVGVGSNGSVDIFINNGQSTVIFDIVGWYASSTASVAPGVGGRLNAVSPQRLLDTREGNGAPTGVVGAGGVVELQIAGRVRNRAGGVAAGITGVVLNLTGTEPSAATYVTAYPSGGVPTASNLNLGGARDAGELGHGESGRRRQGSPLQLRRSHSSGGRCRRLLHRERGPQHVRWPSRADDRAIPGLGHS